MMHQKRIWLLILVIEVVAAGCGSPESQGPSHGPPTVLIATPLQQEVTDHAYFTGRTDAIESVQVRARVSGYLTAINFQDGAEVTRRRYSVRNRSTSLPGGAATSPGPGSSL
jgi:multidrug efflux pump subunit AcrA (membrane-fusion protein)